MPVPWLSPTGLAEIPPQLVVFHHSQVRGLNSLPVRFTPAS